MATRRWSLNPGLQLADVVEAAGAATVTKKIELTVDLATTIVTDNGSTRGISKQEVLLAMEVIKQYIVANIWPPA